MSISQTRKKGTTNASSGKSTHLKKPALTTKEDCEWLANIAAFCDKNNNGMPRAEMISLISELSAAKNLKQAKNHFEYLIRSKQLTTLRNHGRVVSV